MLILGHRGAAGLTAENTLAGFRLAAELGADGVEFDVRTVESELIVLHDASVERTTNGSGDCATLDFATLRTFRTSNGEPIPTLDEALDAVVDLRWVNVEIKSAAAAAGALAALHAARKRHPAWRAEVLLSAFDPDTTAYLARARADCVLGVLYKEAFEHALDRARELAAWSLHLPLADLTDQTIEAVHRAELRALVYTVNEIHDMRRCQALGVDGIFTDYPDRARAIIAPSGEAARP